jgi:ligand-binding sensor domain-containing protein
VFVTNDGGKTWVQSSGGLDGRDVFSLAQAENGSIYAGTSHGLFRLAGQRWEADNRVINAKERTVSVIRNHKKVKRTITLKGKESLIEAQVNDLSLNGPVWFAATADGVYRSTNHGETWTGPVLDEKWYRFVDSHAGVAIAARRTDLQLSQDGGVHWTPVAMPSRLTAVSALATTPNGVLWVGGPEGAFYSEDNGQTWHGLPLPVSGIDNIDYDAGLARVVVASSQSDMIFAVNSDDRSWKWWDTGWKVRMVHSVNGHLVGATLYNGVVVQQQQDGVGASEQARR